MILLGMYLTVRHTPTIEDWMLPSLDNSQGNDKIPSCKIRMGLEPFVPSPIIGVQFARTALETFTELPSTNHAGCSTHTQPLVLRPEQPQNQLQGLLLD